MSEINQINIPQAWEQLELDKLAGSIILVGGTDTGKSTLARGLVKGMVEKGSTVGWIDGDIGQSTLGMPATMDLSVVQDKTRELPAPEASFFVGSTNAAKQLLSIVTGIKRLQDIATSRGINTLVFDTSGFVERARGGLYLKEWKIELLRPDLVVSIQHQRELEPLMAPLRKSSCTMVIDLSVASSIKRKSTEKRIQNRRKKFQYYFSRAVTCTLSISDFPVYDLPLARRYSLAGLLDRFGFCLALGVILEQDRDKVKILVPLPDLTGVAALCVGEVRIDPATGLEIA